MIAQNAIKPVDKSIIQKALNEVLSSRYTSGDLSHWDIQSDASSKAVGMWHYYIVQTHNNIEVRNALANLSVKNGQANLNNIEFVKNLSSKVNSSTPSLNAKTAIINALNYLKIKTTEDLKLINNDKNEYVFSKAGVVQSDIHVKLVYERTNEGTVKLAWNVNLDLNSGQHWWNIRIDAQNGQYISKNDWVTSCYFGESTEIHKAHTDKKLDLNNIFFLLTLNLYLV